MSGASGGRRLLEAQAQGVGCGAQGEEGEHEEQDVLREVPFADIEGQKGGRGEHGRIEDEDHGHVLDDDAQAKGRPSR